MATEQRELSIFSVGSKIMKNGEINMDTTMANIVCPHCGKTLDLDKIIMEQINQRLSEQNSIVVENEVKHRLEEAQKKSQKEMENAVEFAKSEQKQQIDLLTEQIKLLNETNNKQINDMMEIQKKNLELQQKANQSEMEAQKKLNEQYQEIRDNALKEVTESKQAEIDKLNKMLEDANKATEEVKRKLEQGSQQLQGEVQELRLEECLKLEFPLDSIEPVEKGKSGADVIQTVVNRLGRVCGKIVWESKNVKTWNKGFIPKLREDMNLAKGDVGILVSNVFGSNMIEFTEQDGVWLVKPMNAIAMARMIRNRILAVSEVKMAIANKETIQDELYAYFTSAEFRNKIENIGMKYRALDEEINKAKSSMERHWAKQRELIDNIVTNTDVVFGEVSSFMLKSGESLELEQPKDTE